MSDVTVSINGRDVKVTMGTSVAAAVLNGGHTLFRRSVSGQPRAPLCGMGICYECRLTINDEAHARSCQILCQAGMKIVTG